MSESHSEEKHEEKQEEKLGSDEEVKPNVLPVHHPNPPRYAGASGQFPFRMRIKYRGLYDFESLYKFMVGWLKKRGFEFYETLYKSRPPELEIRWLAERKKSGFGMDKIHVHFLSFGDYDVEVVMNGHKKKMFNARLMLTLTAETEAPYEDIFGRRRWNNPMERRLLNFFMKYVVKQEVDLVYMDALYYEANAFQAAIKDHLKMSASGTGY